MSGTVEVLSICQSSRYCGSKFANTQTDTARPPSFVSRVSSLSIDLRHVLVMTTLCFDEPFDPGGP